MSRRRSSIWTGTGAESSDGCTMYVQQERRITVSYSRRRSSSAPLTFLKEALRLRAAARPLQCLMPLQTEELPERIGTKVFKPISSKEFCWPGPAFQSDAAGCKREPHSTRGENGEKGDKVTRHLRMDPTARLVYSRDPSEDVVHSVQESLVFDSKFESGNLARAIMVNPQEYELFLDFDVGTTSHTQWFNFSIENAAPDTKYRFHVMNLMKGSSLYSKGMRVLYRGGRGWQRGGENVVYHANHLHMPACGSKILYTLSFTLSFKDGEGQKCFICHTHPYTYSQLRKDLNELDKIDGVGRFCKRKVMWHSLMGNPVDVLTITGFAPTPLMLRKRKGVMITGRVHPGEANASWILKGLIEFLVSDDPKARFLRDNIVFRIVPMMNPDGVINGNYRCSMSGQDLNRRWQSPDKAVYPEVFHAKELLRDLTKERDVVLYCDVHGHSRKKGVFMYGCGGANGVNERVFPKILSVIAPLFEYNSCSFCVTADKRNTARVVGYRELGVQNSYTLEASFSGSASEHFTTHDLEGLGQSLCHALLHYLDTGTRHEVWMDLKTQLDVTEKDEVGSDSDSDVADEERIVPQTPQPQQQQQPSQKDQEKDQKEEQHKEKEEEEEDPQPPPQPHPTPTPPPLPISPSRSTSVPCIPSPPGKERWKPGASSVSSSLPVYVQRKLPTTAPVEPASELLDLLGNTLGGGDSDSGVDSCVSSDVDEVPTALVPEKPVIVPRRRRRKPRKEPREKKGKGES